MESASLPAKSTPTVENGRSSPTKIENGTGKKSARPRRFWIGSDLLTEEAYRRREREAKEWVGSLALDQSWIARQIGRATETVCTVLNGRDPLPKKRSDTLRLIEDLLGRVEAGEVIPD